MYKRKNVDDGFYSELIQWYNSPLYADIVSIWHDWKIAADEILVGVNSYYRTSPASQEFLLQFHHLYVPEIYNKIDGEIKNVI